MHLILTGATGTVGAPILRHCLASAEVTRLSILARQQFALPKDLDAGKARIFVHEDYGSYPPDMLAELHGADGCIWAQGTSQNSVSVDEYVRITYGFPVAGAKAFAGLSKSGRFNFVHISGKGAESHATLYGKTKARTETALLALPKDPPYAALRIFNVRPGYVDSPEYHPRPGFVRKAVYYGLAPVLRKLKPSIVTPTDALAKVCVDLAVGDGMPLVGEDVIAEGRTLLCEGVRRRGTDLST
ncbi:hypothetical protein B0H13DRAFT_2088346 [Mycena leptocephala]|nr:hypothetical protein B0H13DRAFT_2088346 [Mycena leptocephala]